MFKFIINVYYLIVFFNNYQKIKAQPVKVEDVVCPGGASQCPDQTTCCKLPTGDYGCCKFIYFYSYLFCFNVYF